MYHFLFFLIHIVYGNAILENTSNLVNKTYINSYNNSNTQNEIYKTDIIATNLFKSSIILTIIGLYYCCCYKLCNGMIYKNNDN